MNKGLKLSLTAILLIAIAYVSIHQYLEADLVTKNKQTNTQQVQAQTAEAQTPKVKTSVAVDDPLLDCSDNNFVCEKAVLPPEQQFSYSDYIWANPGDTITYGVTANGESDVQVWIESEDGTFSSDPKDVSANSSKSFTLDAPFDGNFRIVIENSKTTDTDSTEGFIKDPWTN